MGLVLGTNTHMGHKYLYKHPMHTYTFGQTHTQLSKKGHLELFI